MQDTLQKAIPTETEQDTDSNYTVTRADAAEFLGVTERTVDRHLRKGKLDYIRTTDPTQRILINKESLEDFKTGKTPTYQKPKLKKEQGSRPDTKIHHAEKPQTEEGSAISIYKGLYEEARQELYEARKRLEGANYRVGELEAKLSSSIPLLEHQKTQAELLELATTKNTLEKELTTAEKEKTKLEKQVQKEEETAYIEKIKRVAYMTLLLVLIGAWSFSLVLQNL